MSFVNQLEGVPEILEGQPGWVVVAVVALLVIWRVLGKGELRRIIESFHRRATERDKIRLLGSELVRSLTSRPDVRVEMHDSERRRLAPPDPAASLPAAAEDERSSQ